MSGLEDSLAAAKLDGGARASNEFVDAAACGDHAGVEELLQDKTLAAATINALDKDGRTAFHYACTGRADRWWPWSCRVRLSEGATERVALVVPRSSLRGRSRPQVPQRRRAAAAFAPRGRESRRLGDVAARRHGPAHGGALRGAGGAPVVDRGRPRVRGLEKQLLRDAVASGTFAARIIFVDRSRIFRRDTESDAAGGGLGRPRRGQGRGALVGRRRVSHRHGPVAPRAERRVARQRGERAGQGLRGARSPRGSFSDESRRRRGRSTWIFRGYESRRRRGRSTWKFGRGRRAPQVPRDAAGRRRGRRGRVAIVRGERTRDGGRRGRAAEGGAAETKGEHLRAAGRRQTQEVDDDGPDHVLGDLRRAAEGRRRRRRREGRRPARALEARGLPGRPRRDRAASRGPGRRAGRRRRVWADGVA